MVCAQWQAVTRCFHSWCNFMAIRLPVCGTTTMVRPTRSGREKEKSRAILLPMLCALGQHQALLSVQSRLRPHERLLAFHDDVSAVAQPERIVAVHKILGEELWQHRRIRINAGKTQIWNRGGPCPQGTKPSSTKIEPSILTQRSGLVVLIVLWKNVASEFWALLLAQQSMSGRSWMPPRPLTSCCFSGSQQCRTCSQRGFFCCFALHHGRHFTCGYAILTTRKFSAFSDTEKASHVSPLRGRLDSILSRSASCSYVACAPPPLPPPFTARRCRCGRPLDPCGDHRAACAGVGVLGRRGFALESAAARVCREAGRRS